MLGLNRNLETSAAQNPAPRSFRPPKGLATVCPEIGDAKHTFYEAPSVAIANRLRLLPMSFDASEEHPSRLSWQYAVAVESINMLDHFPLQAIVNTHGDNKWDFHRSVFWRGLVAGVGSWLQLITLKSKQGKSINPLTEGWELVDRLSESSKGVRYPCTVAPSTAELLVATESGLLALADTLDPQIHKLFLDSFGADHHGRNPVASAVARAQIKVRKRLNNRGFLIDDKLGISWMNRTEVLQIETFAHPPKDPVEAGKVVQAPEPQTPRPAQDSDPVAAGNPTPPASEPEAQMRSKDQVKSAGIKPDSRFMESKKPQRPATEGPGSGDIDPRMVAKLIRERLKSGVFMLNRLGAQVEVGPHGVGLVLPKTLYQVAEMMSVPYGQLEPVVMGQMIDPRLSHPKLDYRMHRQGRGWNKLKLAVLQDEWVEQIFPEGAPEANPAIKVPEPRR